MSQRTRFNYIQGQAPEETIEIIVGFRPSPASNAYIMETAISYSGITGASGRGSLGSIGTNKGTYNDMKVRFENPKVEYERKESALASDFSSYNRHLGAYNTEIGADMSEVV